jgi:hypothetical protein
MISSAGAGGSTTDQSDRCHPEVVVEAFLRQLPLTQVLIASVVRDLSHTDISPELLPPRPLEGALQLDLICIYAQHPCYPEGSDFLLHWPMPSVYVDESPGSIHCFTSWYSC